MSINTLNRAQQTGLVTGLTATGTNQGTAYPLARNCFVEFTTVASGTGCLLPPILVPCTLEIQNSGANALLIYPQPGGTINGGSVNGSYSLPAAQAVIFTASSLTNWYTYGGSPAGSGTGTVTSIAAGTGLTGGTITTSGTIALSTPVSVANGGTGAATLTAHGVLVGEGTSAIVATAVGTSGQLFIGQGASADPSFNTMSGDATITNAGVLTIANSAVTTAKINAAAVTYAKVQNVGAHALLGNPTGSGAAPSEITLGTGLAFSGTTLTASAAAVNANAFEVSLCGAA
jgi:hypothetical protein